MVISRSEGTPWHGQHTPVLPVKLDAKGSSAVMAARGRSQPVNQAQDLSEQPPRHRHLGKLEHDVPTVPDHLGADLDQLLSKRVQ